MNFNQKHFNFDELSETQLNKVLKQSKKIKKQKQEYYYDINKVEADFLLLSNQYKNLKLPQINNVVSTVILQMKSEEGFDWPFLDLQQLAERGRNCEYDENRLPMVIQRLKCGGVAHICSNGKIVLHNDSVNDIDECLRKFLRPIEKMFRIKIAIKEISISNICAHGQLPFRINSKCISSIEKQQTRIYFKAYDSGKIQFLGASDEIQIKSSFVSLCRSLKKYEQ